MPDVTSPHDLLFRQMLSRSETAQDFLRSYVSDAVLSCLDLESLEIMRDSFVDSDLRLRVSDLIYRANLTRGGHAYLYFLFEHKSHPDPLVALQLLRYMTRLWDQGLRQQRTLPLPPVIPLVFFHGRSGWTVSTEFSGLFQCPRELEAFTPRFRYALVDLSHHSQEAIRGGVVVQAMLLAMRHIFDDDLEQRVPRILGLLQAVAATRTGMEALEALLRYFSSASERVGERELREAMKQAFPHKGDRIMATLADKWIQDGIDKGIERGIEQGIQQGMEQGIQQGMEQGIRQGMEQGIRQGIQQGIEQGIRQGAVGTAREFLLELLETRFGGVPAELRERIRGTEEVGVLRLLCRTAASASSVEAFHAVLQTALPEP